MLVLVEERVPGLGWEVRLGELGVDPGVGLWVTGLGQLVVPRLWLGLVLGREISSEVVRC